MADDDQGYVQPQRSAADSRQPRTVGVILMGTLVLVGALVALRQDSPSTLATAGDPVICDPVASDHPYCLGEPETTTTTLDVNTTVTAPPAPGLPSVPVVRLEGSDGPLRVSIEIEPPNATAGEIVKFVLRSTDPSDRERATGANYGDGGHYALPLAPHLDCYAEGTTTTTAGADEDQTITYQHAYRLPGTYPVSFRVTSAGCAGLTSKVDLKGTVVVGPGPLLSNGPLPPIVVGAHQLPDAASRTVELNVHVRDLDGYILRVHVDWEDGSPQSVKSYSPAFCVDPRSHWPGPSSDSFTQTHTYEASGSYDVTVTVDSVGCTETDKQTSVKTTTVTAT
jgi:hypothetical protein